MSKEEYAARANRLFEGRKHEAEDREFVPPDEEGEPDVADDFPPTVAALFETYGQG